MRISSQSLNFLSSMVFFAMPLAIFSALFPNREPVHSGVFYTRRQIYLVFLHLETLAKNTKGNCLHVTNWANHNNR